MPAHPSLQLKVRRFRVQQRSPATDSAKRRRSASPTRRLQPSASASDTPATQASSEVGPLDALQVIPRDGLSCDRCRTLKKKCSRTFPTCSLCANAGRTCSLSTLPESLASQVQRLQARVAWLTEIANAELSLPNRGGIETFETGTQISLPSPFSPHTTSSNTQNEFVSEISPNSASREDAADRTNKSHLTRGDLADGTAQAIAQTSDRSRIRRESQGAVQPNRSTLVSIASELPCSDIAPELQNYSRHGHQKRIGDLADSSRAAVHGLTPDAFARQCVDAYFQHVNRAYPFVDKTKMELEVGVIDNWELLGTPSSAYSTLLHLVMAIGCTTLERAGKLPNEASSVFKIAYPRIVQECMGRDDLESLQILVLVALYSLFDPGGMSAWAIAGIAARQAILLGMSRKGSEKGSMSSVEVENRHRLFWNIWVLDRMMAFSLGMPVALADESHDVPLPGLTVEEFASANRQNFTTMLQTNRQIIHLRQLEDRILRQVLLRKAMDVAAMSHVDCRSLTHAIRAQIEDWYSNGCLVSPLDADSVPIHGSITWSSSRYYHLLFFLHYPCPFNFKGSNLLAKELLPLAQKSLQLNSVLLQQRQLPLNRVTLCRLFPVGLVLMHCLAQHSSLQPPGPARQDAMAMVHILEAFSPTWTEAHKAAKVFHQFLRNLSLAEIIGDRAYPAIPQHRGESYEDLYSATRWPSSSGTSPLLRSSILEFTTIMGRVLGAASCYLFDELPVSESQTHPAPFGNHALANSTLDLVLPPMPAANSETSKAFPEEDSWQFLDLAFF